MSYGKMWYNLPNECTVDKPIAAVMSRMVEYLINNTNDMIRYAAFRFFLERGYEATNIRDICKEVDIKASSLYFYYTSKKELFFSIYEDIWKGKIQHLKNTDGFYNLYIKSVEYYSQNIANQKFLLRYHLFPPQEISITLREKFRFWTNEENKIILDIVGECFDKKILDSNRLPEDYLDKYRKFDTSLFTGMVISNIKMNPKELDMMWSKFWNCTMLN